VPALETDVVVIGAGINGIATAYELAREGRAVVVIEQFQLGHSRGSSHGASRVFRLSYPEPAWIRRAQEALVAWRRLEAEFGEQLLRTTGSVDVGSYADANAAALETCSVGATELDAAEAHARWGLRLEPHETALFQPDAGVLAAARAHAAFLEGARRRGAEILPVTRVTSIDVDAGRVRLATSAGEVGASAAVVAAGPWSAALLAPLGIELDVTPTRETVAYLDLDGADTLPVLILGRPEDDDEVGTYALADGAATLKVGVHRSGPVADPDETADPERWIADWALQWISARLPSRRAALDRLDTCLYTNTDDESFVLRRDGQIVVVSACSGHAFKFAPLTGRDAAALALEAVG
jgi:sarcosine oxidase